MSAAVVDSTSRTSTPPERGCRKTRWPRPVCQLPGVSRSGGPSRPPGMDTAEAWGPNLPLAEFDFAQDEARVLVDAFETVRARARGLAAAPASWLPAPGDRLAGAL